ncbi:beta-phosphoglucomutase [Aquimarina brevivitae]|uniref:Beta-phosphoglucomutase n=1 Tax=Aquimarina brevivitae TaxID=323412 RepID=A0A4Q7NYM3_9FLAO|nr:beta-phosphoglucomutase [Aquimarina brevivitae]RZS92546.1 beta-phosphoglucomutase [Aquimarina brevivitae]
MNRKGFIFDLDGVIVDTAKYHFLAWQNLANELGIPFTEEQNEQLKGVSRVKSLEKILEWGNTSISEDQFQKLMNDKNEEYLAYIATMDESEILPDVPRVLDFLCSKNQPIALGSASKNARIILEKVGLYSKFDTIVDGTNVTKAKPDPEVFILGASQLGVPNKQCIVFEDSLAGIQAANNAGMISIGIGDKNVLTEANYVFADFTQIHQDFINQLINS